MQSHGASAPGEAFWALAVGVMLYGFLSLRAGAFTLSDAHKITLEERPLLYWGVMLFLVAVAGLLFGFGLYLLRRSL